VSETSLSVSSSDSDVDQYVIIRKSLDYFQHAMGTTVVIPEILLNMQDFSFVRFLLKVWYILKNVLSKE
jgi:hypothetical protein